MKYDKSLQSFCSVWSWSASLSQSSFPTAWLTDLLSLLFDPRSSPVPSGWMVIFRFLQRWSVGIKSGLSGLTSTELLWNHFIGDFSCVLGILWSILRFLLRISVFLAASNFPSIVTTPVPADGPAHSFTLTPSKSLHRGINKVFFSFMLHSKDGRTSDDWSSARCFPHTPCSWGLKRFWSHHQMRERYFSGSGSPSGVFLLQTRCRRSRSFSHQGEASSQPNNFYKSCVLLTGLGAVCAWAGGKYDNWFQQKSSWWRM